jgi:ankyrin repeat protein
MSDTTTTLIDFSNDTNTNDSTDGDLDVDLESFLRDNYDNILSVFQCPLTTFIMFDPVVADDGNIYEADAIKECYRTGSKISPMTRQPISNNFRQVPLLNELIKTFVKYGEKIDPDIKELMNIPSVEFSDNKENIYNCLSGGTDNNSSSFDKLLKFKNYKLDDRYTTKTFIFELLTKCSRFDVIKYVFENCTDLNFIQNDQSTVVHYVCGYSTPEVIKYIIDRKDEENFDLDKETTEKRRPFTQLLENKNCNDFDIQKLLLDNLKDINYTTADGNTMFHQICTSGDPGLVRYLITEKDPNLFERVNGKLPVMKVIERRIFDDLIILMIDKMIEVDPASVEISDDSGKRLSHYLCESFVGGYKSNRILEYVFSKMDLKAKTGDTYETPINMIFSNGNNDDIIFCLDKCDNISEHLTTATGVENKLPVFSIIENRGDSALITRIIDMMYTTYPYSLEQCTVEGWRPSHYLCRYKAANIASVKKIFEMGLDFEAVTNDGWRPFHFICHYGTYDTIAYVMGMGISLDSPINRYQGEDKTYLPINMIELNNNLSDDLKETLIAEILQYIEIVKMTIGL